MMTTGVEILDKNQVIATRRFLQTASYVITQALVLCGRFGLLSTFVHPNEGHQTVHLKTPDGTYLRITNNSVRQEENQGDLKTISLGDLGGGLFLDGRKPDNTSFSYQLPRDPSRLTSTFYNKFQEMTIDELDKLHEQLFSICQENCMLTDEYLKRVLIVSVDHSR